jgi:hypothetical protein
MSTKTTITHGDDFHVYQETFEKDKVYIQIDKHGGYLKVENKTLTISLSVEQLDKIAKGWLKNKNKINLGVLDMDEILEDII